MVCPKAFGRRFPRLALAVLIGAAASRMQAQDGSWVVNGPDGGSAYCLVEDAASSTLYAGTDDGVLAGRRDGLLWARANAGLEGIRVRTIAIDPGEPQTLYAGTVTPNGVPSVGIFKSMDAGAHWTAANAGLIDPFTLIEPLDVAAIAIDPTDSSVLLAGTRFSEIFRSVDRGSTWLPTTLGGFGAGLVTTAIRYDPFDPTVVYAVSSLGFMASGDRGETWGFAGDLAISFTDLAVDPSTSGTLYAVNNTGFGVFKSTNFGNHWADANNGLSINGVYPLVDAVAVDPSDPQTVIIGTAGNGAFLSRDGAASWAPAGPGTIGAFAASIVFLSATPAVCVGTVGDGVFRSVDGADTWTASSTGFRASLVAAMIADPAVAGRVLAAAFNGIRVSTNGGASWADSDAGLPDFPVASLARGADGKLFAGTLGGGLFASTDDGKSWKASANGLADLFVASVAADPSDPLTLYAGTSHPYDGTNSERVYKSADGGSSWTQTGLDAQGFSIGRLIVNPARPTEIAAVTPGTGFFFQTTDGGSSWSTVTPSAACGAVNTVYYDDPRSALLVGAQGGVCRSTDGGSSWTLISVAPLASVLTFFADPAGGAALYAGAEPLVPGGTGGVFHSTDGGLTWAPVGAGLDAESVRAIARDASGDRLYAALYGRSVATFPLSVPSRTPVESAAPRPPPHVSSR